MAGPKRNPWCKVLGNPGSFRGGFDLSFEPNDTFGERTARVTISSGGNLSVAIVVRQLSPDLSLALSEDALEFYREADSYRVTIACNNSWEASSSHSWCKAPPDGNQLRIEVTENLSGNERSAKVTVVTSGEGKSVMKTISILQNARKSQLIVSPTQKEAAAAGEQFSVSVMATSAWKAVTDCDWTSIDRATGDSDAIIGVSVAPNDTSKPRTATITLSTTSQDTEREVRTVSITQQAAGLEVLTEEIQMNGMGETQTIPVVSVHGFRVRSSSSWCKTQVEGEGVVVTAELNDTGSERQAIVTVLSELDPGIFRTFKVIQPDADVRFSISPAECDLIYEGESKQVTVTTMGEWKVMTEELPKWLTVTPLSGSGSGTVTVTATKNIFIKERTCELTLRNLTFGQVAVLTIRQAKNPSSAIDDYKYLGKGYDAKGEFATDTYVRSQVLDWDKLSERDYIADIIVASNTYEHNIHEKTLSEFQKALSHTAGISGHYSGFSASVQGSYSSKALTSQEYEFASFRHITQKQIVKLNEQLGAADLIDCMTETAASEICGTTMAPEQAVQKYGTHIIAGFVLGGSLDYTMSADVSSVLSTFEWGVAVKAGYESKSAGISANYAYDQYEALKNESSNFEEKLVARGGDSQLASMLGTAANRSEWLGSLSQPEKWVMVDYAGRMLLPIWEFASGARRTALEQAALAHIQSGEITQTTSHKEFRIEATALQFLDTDQYDEATVAYRLYATVDHYDQERFGTTHKPEGGKGDVELKPSGKETVQIDHTTSTYKFSSYRVHTLTLKIEGDEKDYKTDDDDPFKMQVTLVYDVSTGKWNRQGTQESYGNGDAFWVVTTKNGQPVDDGGGVAQASFCFRLHWTHPAP